MLTTDDRSGSRPAIPETPLPQAGESLQDELIKQVYGGGLLWAIIGISLGSILFQEWLQYLMGVHPTLGSCIFATVLCAAIGVVAWTKARNAFRRAKILRLGIRGEIHVGKYLDDQCRPLGYRVIHDIPCKSDVGGTDFNIDHALIGPGGIFCIETKNWSKPPRGRDATIIVRRTPDGEVLEMDDGSFDTRALKQARANANKLRKLLSDETGEDAKSFHVHPVLLIPGWYIKGEAEDVWVLNDKTLHQWLPNEPTRLNEAEINLLYNKLAGYVREARE